MPKEKRIRRGDWPGDGAIVVCAACGCDFRTARMPRPPEPRVGLDGDHIFCAVCTAEQDARDRRVAAVMDWEDTRASAQSWRRRVTPETRREEEARRDIERRRIGAEIDAEIMAEQAEQAPPTTDKIT